MRCAAVIAEYNPFHAGHGWMLEQVRRRGATHIVAVMSGNFVQRGEPALFEESVRAAAALACGADLVVSLPLPWAVAGAQRFARGGVALARALGCVDTLAFGCESGSSGPSGLLEPSGFSKPQEDALEPLERALEALGRAEVRAALRHGLSAGETFARARADAVRAVCGAQTAQVLATPNNALALEYLAALRAPGGGIAPLAIPRAGAGHDAPLDGAGRFASASALRALYHRHGGAALEPYIPAAALSALISAPHVPPGALETALLARLRALPREALSGLPELSEGLENRLWRAVREAVTLDGLYSALKSKRYTHARVRRLALAAFLDLREELCAGLPPFIRVLGYTSAGKELLTGGTALPLSTSLKRLEELGGTCRACARLEAAAGDQYALLLSPRAPCGGMYRKKPFTC